MVKKRFIKDMNILLEKIELATSSEVLDQLYEVRDRFVELSKKRLVKINHSIMQFLCAKHLIENGFRVKIEYPLNGGALMADIFAVRERMLDINDDAKDAILSEMHGTSENEETLVVEVETGFVPPKAALYPGTYRLTRIAAKIARYAGFSHFFSLATPHYHVLQIPNAMLQSVGKRDSAELSKLKDLCDSQYLSPPVLYNELATSEIHSIFVVNVDQIKVLEVDPQKYRYTVIQAEGIIQM
ncbi:MAG: hypothetical protein AM325_013985 [Candidatus Thorarchaeota archaeon SMTZ1-45]|nr:MAG: hypothetical protein AM325_15500 [Candidatus Thorarchaeota archaeon SMTZ1-45]